MATTANYGWTKPENGQVANATPIADALDDIDELIASIGLGGGGGGASGAFSGTLAIGSGSVQTTYQALISASDADDRVALRVNQLSTAAVDAVKIVNDSNAYALKVDQSGSGGVHDTVNISAMFTGGHTALGIVSQNTTLSTVKVTNSAVQTGGQVIAAVASDSSRTASVFGADNSGAGSSYLSQMQGGATAAAFQATYDSGSTFTSRVLWIAARHTAGDLIYIDNASAQTAGSLIKLVHSNSSSTAPLLQLSPHASGTANQITGSNFSVDKDGFVRTNQILNYTSFNNARVIPAAAGTTIDRNIADANPVLIVSAIHASSTGDVLQIKGAGAALGSRFGPAGRFFTRVNSAPADGDVATSELCMWFDNTNGAAKAMFKGKQANGTVVTGSVALT